MTEQSHQKIYLNVPFEEKDLAKKYGAKWDPLCKQWFTFESSDLKQFAKWLIEPTNDTQKKVKLFVDLVPQSAWFSNLRSELTTGEWDALRKKTYSKARSLCEACGGKGSKHPVECHERWEYNSIEKIQILTGTVALCPACHETTHFGLASIRYRDEEAKLNLMRVNNWDSDKADRHIEKAMMIWNKRSQIQWMLDLRWLINVIELSGATINKILMHAEGIAERTVKDWQKEIINEYDLHV